MKRFIKYLSIATLFAIALVVNPAIKAQSVDFAQLIATNDVAPEERLSKKVELTTDALKKAGERVAEMHAKLEAIKFADETPELELRGKLIERADGYSVFYNEKLVALEGIKTLEEIDLIIDEVITYRESEYAAGAKEILEFILVYSYTPSVLVLADERLENIVQDVTRLESLDLIEPSVFVSKTEEAKDILQKARDLQAQGATLLMENYATSLLIPTPIEGEMLAVTPDPLVIISTPRSLAEQSLADIKKLYELFIETGEQVGQTLGIN